MHEVGQNDLVLSDLEVFILGLKKNCFGAKRRLDVHLETNQSKRKSFYILFCLAHSILQELLPRIKLVQIQSSFLSNVGLTVESLEWYEVKFSFVLLFLIGKGYFKIIPNMLFALEEGGAVGYFVTHALCFGHLCTLTPRVVRAKIPAPCARVRHRHPWR